MRKRQLNPPYPKRKTTAVMLALLAAAVLCFAAVLRHSWRAVTALDPGGYIIGAPAGFSYTAAPSVRNGAYHLEGWACVAGEKMSTVDCRVLLYDNDSGRYYSLPTLAGILTDEATEAMDDGNIYGRAGYSAVASLKNLQDNYAAMELCFAYRSNSNNHIVHTGQAAMGGGV